MIFLLYILFLPGAHSLDPEIVRNSKRKTNNIISVHEPKATDVENLNSSTIEDSTQKEYEVLRTRYGSSINSPEDMLFSSSFEFVARTFGALATTVRVTGDTAAGVLGSSIKLVGVAVKSTAFQLDEAGKWVEDRKTSQKTQFYKPEKRYDLPTKSTTQSMASQSIKQMGKVVEEVGHLLIKTGEATESITSLAASVAEGSMLFLQDFANDISQTSSPNHLKKRLLIRPIQGSSLKNEPSFSFGAYNESKSSEAEKTTSLEQKYAFIIDYLHFFARYLFSETAGVPSQALELLLAILLCYLAAILILGESGGNMSKHQGNNRCGQYTIPLRKAPLPRPGRFYRYMLLLVIFLFLYVQICYTSQLRSKLIHAGAEANGVRSTLSSKQDGKSQETLVWFNALLHHFWQVPSLDCPPYSDFVRAGIKACSENHSANCLGDRISCEQYGGLEPFLSWKVGSVLSRALQKSMSSTSKQDAFVSLHSITLGSRPPLIRSIEFLSESEGGQFIDYLVDADLFLDDLLIVLEIKMSALDYAILPRTKISVGSLLTNIKFRIRIHQNPYPPFFGKLEFSLQQVPEFHVRIRSLSKGSLHGIDLSSLPLIRDLLRSTYHRIMTAFVSPKYLVADISNLSNNFIAALHDYNLQPSSLAFAPHSWTRSSREKRYETGSTIVTDETKNQVNPRKQHRSIALVRPKTKVAQIGMELWLKSNSNTGNAQQKHEVII